MTFPLDKLPQEVISYHLVKYLYATDIINLVRMGYLWNIDENLYHKVFQDNARFKEYNIEMFKKRLNAEMYIFGNHHNGLPWHPLQTVTNDDVHTRIDICLENTMPYKVNGSRKGFLQIAHGCRYSQHVPESWRSTQIQTIDSEGNIKVRKEPSSSFGDDLLAAITVESIKEGSRFKTPSPLHCTRYLEQCLIKGRPRKCARFTQVSSSLGLFLAVDESQWIWQWNDEESSTLKFPLCALKSSEGTHALLNGPVYKVAVSKFFGSCLTEGGIAFWRRNDVNRQFSEGKYGVVLAMETPLTENGLVKDYEFVSESVLLCLLQDGSMVSLKVHIKADVELHFKYKCTKHIPAQLNELKGPGYLTLSTANTGGNFALLRKDGVVVTARHTLSLQQNEEDVFEVTNVIENLDLASVEAGANHFLGLSHNGDVYSWGEDIFLSGCLGYSKDGEENRAYMDKSDALLRIGPKPPVKLTLPGKVCAILAGEDYSAVLI